MSELNQQMWLLINQARVNKSEKEGDTGLFITCFLIRWLNNFGDFK